MVNAAWNYIVAGQYDQALLWILNDYIGYGIIWLLFGVMIFGAVYKKSKSIAITGFFFALFMAVVGSVFPVEVQPYLLVLVGLCLFIIVYRILRS